MALCITTSMITDEKAELEGVWTSYESGAELLLARYNNEEAQKIRIERYRENKAAIDAGGELGEKLAMEAEIEAMSQAVLKGWTGIIDDKGEEVPFSVDTAKTYLTLSKDFRKDVQMLSAGREKYLAQNLKADAAKAKK